MMLRLAHMIEDDPQLRADWDARVEAQRDLTVMTNMYFFVNKYAKINMEIYIYLFIYLFILLIN